MDCGRPGSSLHGISQARTLEWAAISSSRVPSQPRNWTHVSWVSFIGRRILHHWATWEAPHFQDPGTKTSQILVIQQEPIQSFFLASFWSPQMVKSAPLLLILYHYPHHHHHNHQRKKLLSALFHSPGILMCLREKLHICYGVNCAPPHQFICWKLNTQCDGIRSWGLWEVIRSRWGHENGTLMMGLIPF